MLKYIDKNAYMLRVEDGNYLLSLIAVHSPSTQRIRELDFCMNHVGFRLRVA